MSLQAVVLDRVRCSPLHAGRVLYPDHRRLRGVGRRNPRPTIYRPGMSAHRRPRPAAKIKGSAGCGALPGLAGLTFGSALVSPGGVLRVNNASYSAVLVRLHAALHSVSCNDVQRRKLLHPQYSPPSFAQMGGTRQPRRVTQRSLVCRVTMDRATSLSGKKAEAPSSLGPRRPSTRVLLRLVA